VISKNYVLSLPPSYMEVSYKLFIIIIYNLLTKSRDLSKLPTLRTLKRLPVTSTGLTPTGFKLMY
jgi:hypothetical protein